MIYHGVSWSWILIDETARGVSAKLGTWKQALESKGFRISRSKTEYLECRFSNSQSDSVDRVTLQNQQIPRRKRFNYLGPMLVWKDCR